MFPVCMSFQGHVSVLVIAMFILALGYFVPTLVLSVTGSLYNCYVYFLVSVLRAAEALKNCYIVFCKLLSFSEYENWMHNMVFFC
jgi:hypothetical protein